MSRDLGGDMDPLDMLTVDRALTQLVRDGNVQVRQLHTALHRRAAARHVWKVERARLLLELRASNELGQRTSVDDRDAWVIMHQSSKGEAMEDLHWQMVAADAEAEAAAEASKMIREAIGAMRTHAANVRDAVGRASGVGG